MKSTDIDVETVKLMGLGDIAHLWKLKSTVIYSRWSRGQLGKADWIVAVPRDKPDGGTPVFLADRFSKVPYEMDTSPVEGELPRLVGMDELAVIMDVGRGTVLAMRFRGQKEFPAPPPYATVSRSPVWWLDPWKKFARDTGRSWDLRRLARLDKERGR